MSELKKLLAEAQTDEPWSVVWYGDEHLPAIAIHRTAEDRICFMPTIQHPADGVQFEANAALIVAAVNALPELLAVKAERDRAQRACEQMGARIASLENLIRAMIENEPDDIVADGGHTVLDLWRHDARAALKETGSFTDDPFNRAVLGLPLETDQ